MSDEFDSMRELQAQAVRLGDRDWRMVMEAATALAHAGQAGLAAVLWGLSHPNARVRRGCAGFLDHHATDACIPQLRWVALHDPASKVRRAPPDVCERKPSVDCALNHGMPALSRLWSRSCAPKPMHTCEARLTMRSNTRTRTTKRLSMKRLGSRG